jgi:glycosyltransferase involved in cell wall biosynthesis
MANVEPPFVTIIIPVRNEDGHIVEFPGCIFSQDYPEDGMEVIVADGYSDDNTPQIVTECAKRHSNLRFVHNPGRIVPTGLNLALAAAKGEVIVRVDGHTTIESDYVRRCVEALERPGAANVGGRMDAVGRGLFGEAVAAATLQRSGLVRAEYPFSETSVFEALRQTRSSRGRRARGQGARCRIRPSVIDKLLGLRSSDRLLPDPTVTEAKER